jgi:hypothetical protein
MEQTRITIDTHTLIGQQLKTEIRHNLEGYLKGISVGAGFVTIQDIHLKSPKAILHYGFPINNRNLPKNVNMCKGQVSLDNRVFFVEIKSCLFIMIVAIIDKTCPYNAISQAKIVQFLLTFQATNVGWVEERNPT